MKRFRDTRAWVADLDHGTYLRAGSAVLRVAGRLRVVGR